MATGQVNAWTRSRNGFFFFSSGRRHTRLQGAWSSAVCSSDLLSFTTAEFWIALARHVAIQNSAVVKDTLPLLAFVAGEVGDNQVRNMGTIGGVVAHADAAGDYPTIALILDADIVTNRRTIPAKDFFKDLFTTPLEANEIVTEIVFPVANGPHKYIKFRRRLFDWAIVGAAAQKMDGHWRIGLTNVGPTPVRAKAVEDALGKGAKPEEAAQHASDGLNPAGDLRANPEYKKHLTRVLTRRAIEQAQQPG